MKKRIFVVDDDASVRESLRKVLVDAGHQVFVAGDGLEAQTILQGTGVDLMILDINMPVRDGWDVLEDLSAKHPSLPVVMITGIYDQLETTLIPRVSGFIGETAWKWSLLPENPWKGFVWGENGTGETPFFPKSGPMGAFGMAR